MQKSSRESWKASKIHPLSWLICAAAHHMQFADLPFSILGTYYVFTASKLGTKMSVMAMLSTISSSVMVQVLFIKHCSAVPSTKVVIILQLGVKLCKLPALKALWVRKNNGTAIVKLLHLCIVP